jgi:hypothetical protein
MRWRSIRPACAPSAAGLPMPNVDPNLWLPHPERGPSPGLVYRVHESGALQHWSPSVAAWMPGTRDPATRRGLYESARASYADTWCEPESPGYGGF